MEVYKRISILLIFNFFVLNSNIAEDTLRTLRCGLYFSSGFSYFQLNDKKDRKYYSGVYAGGFITAGYERKYFIMELKYQYGRSNDAGYHFGEWNLGVKADFLKRHRFALMTGLYAYRTDRPISITIKNLPFYRVEYYPNSFVYYGGPKIFYEYERDTLFSFYQGSSNFMRMDISTGKFKLVGTNLMYMLLMHLKLAYNIKLSKNFNLSVSGTTYFSNAIDEYVSLFNLGNITTNNYVIITDNNKKTSYKLPNTKYILNEGSNPPMVYNREHIKQNNIPLFYDGYYVPKNILLCINMSLHFKF